MKTILVAAVSTVGLLATPAFAGKSKKQDSAKKPAPVVVAEAAPPTIEAAVAKAIIDETHPSSAELVAIPDLPVDMSNAFSQMPALAPPPVLKAVAKKPGKAPIMKTGANYVLGARKVADQPKEEVQQIVPRGLSQPQIVDFMNAHTDDIQLCWNKLPASHRAEAATALLRLAVSDQGKVTDVEVDGDVPAGVHKCITSAVARWQFPIAEAATDIEYGISLRSVY